MLERVLFDNVALRRLRVSDADQLYELIAANREYLARWLPWASSGTRADTLAHLRRAERQLALNDGIQTAITVEGAIAGSVGVHAINWLHASTSIGYWLAPQHQGRGIMTAAVRAYTDHAFETWRLHRMELRAAVTNARSRAVAQRLGFTLEGVLRGAERVGDHTYDLAVYSMLAPEWNERR